MRYLQELYLHQSRIERSVREEMVRDLPHIACKTAATETSASISGDKSNDAVKYSKDPSQEQEQLLNADRVFKRKAMLPQLSHVEMLQLLDDTVTSQLEGLLTLDYFKVFDESLDFLKAIVEAFGPELRERVCYNDETRPACLGQLPLHLVQNLDEDEDGVIGTLVETCRGFLVGLERGAVAV